MPNIIFEELSTAAISKLIAGSRSPNPAIRLNSAKVLGSKGRSAEAHAALTVLLSDPSIDVRRVAVGACLALNMDSNW